MRTSCFARAAAGLAILAFAAAANAAYPDKPIQYIIPFAPGGESDVAARLQQQTFKVKFNQDLIVVNKAGAGGALAWSQLNSMPGDGYTIMGVNLPHIVLQPLEAGTQFKTEDITPVYFFHYTPDAIIVPQDSPFKTFADLVKAAREKPDSVSLAGSGTNSANHIASERLNRESGSRRSMSRSRARGTSCLPCWGITFPERCRIRRWPSSRRARCACSRSPLKNGCRNFPTYRRSRSWD